MFVMSDLEVVGNRKLDLRRLNAQGSSIAVILGECIGVSGLVLGWKIRRAGCASFGG